MTRLMYCSTIANGVANSWVHELELRGRRRAHHFKRASWTRKLPKSRTWEVCYYLAVQSFVSSWAVHVIP